uniref:carnosine N-methyltransferase n=1 Tax=Syphacia muris TaxID=451379 RepID=A0A0N5AA70_9BILA
MSYSKKRKVYTILKFRNLTQEQQILLSPGFPESIKRMKYCVEENYKIIQMIISYGVSIFGDDCSMREAVKRAQTTWSVSEHYMSKVKSTLKQIVRDWSTEGASERNACYSRVKETLCSHFTDKEKRYEVNVLVPGAGLGRLAWDFVQEGFTVQGNEFSLFMLLTSNFIFNKGLEANNFTIYPYVLETCNNWSYEDQLRPIKFPDFTLENKCSILKRPNTFSMCAGDFLQVTKCDECKWSAVVTVFFMDTAVNIIEYIDAIYKILKVSGIWINLGPLTYHFTDSDGALELPYNEVINLIRQRGFKLVLLIEIQINFKALYASNSKSMLHYEYHCGFFKCIKV